ncbi:MAG: hypothetical protein QOG85_154 [Gaiellaceae bacterium]|jgi:hypothetical protein|nr:hypothetical protein [Gaiellaceae bacterium]
MWRTGTVSHAMLSTGRARSVWKGRWGSAAAAADPRSAKRGPKARYTEEQAEKVREKHSRNPKLGLRTLAAIVNTEFPDERPLTKNQVARILAA